MHGTEVGPLETRVDSTTMPDNRQEPIGGDEVSSFAPPILQAVMAEHHFKTWVSVVLSVEALRT